MAVVPPRRDIDLKDPWIAALLAWLVPGLGHLYQGRLHKAVLFFVVIMSLFIAGQCMGAGRVVYFRWDNDEWRVPYLAQVGVGLPALPAMLDAFDVRPALARFGLPASVQSYCARPLNGREFNALCTKLGVGQAFTEQEEVVAKRAAEVRQEQGAHYIVLLSEVDDLHRSLGRWMDVALIYTMIAGLLNILVVYDALDGPAAHKEELAASAGSEDGPNSETNS